MPQLVFFKDAVEHILRAARVYRQPGGHMLMVGNFISARKLSMDSKSDLFKTYTIWNSVRLIKILFSVVNLLVVKYTDDCL